MLVARFPKSESLGLFESFLKQSDLGFSGIPSSWTLIFWDQDPKS